MIFLGAAIVRGGTSGEIFACPPLSFWGGFNAKLGIVTDVSHEAYRKSLAGKVLVMSAGRGSSSATSVLAEAIRLGTAPAAIVMREPDSILTVGAMVAAALYDKHCPIVVLNQQDHAALALLIGLARVNAGDAAGQVEVCVGVARHH